MEMKRARGLTLVEIMVAMTISLTVGLIAVSIFVAASHMLAVNTTSYLISRDLSLGIEEVKTSLKETALGTITVSSDSTPAFSMVTAMDEDGKTTLNSQGYPVWQGWHHFFLQLEQDQPTGSLVKWREPSDTMLIPAVSQTDPLSLNGAQNQKVLLQNVVKPGATLTDSQGQPLKVSEDDGFALRFIRLSGGDYVTDSTNPAVYSQEGKDLAGNTRLVELALRTYSKNSVDKSDSVGLRIRICPRY